MRKLAILAIVAGVGLAARAAQEVQLASRPDSVKFAVIGDNGSGEQPQYDVGRQMAAARARFPFELVLMLGDNMYGRQQPQDFIDKFERPYADLLRAGIPFYAALGNHDNASNRFYKGFNMGGERYYTFVRRNVRFVVLDTNGMDRPQLSWLEGILKKAYEEWTICYFHHPLYSDAGRHGPNLELRVVLEPLFVRYGVDVVFSGHEHVYERTKPQRGITYFIEGASGQLRKGDVKASDGTAAFYHDDQSFMLVEIAGDEMVFQVVSRTGIVVDSGLIRPGPIHTE